ncbi:MAG: carboxypeptidase regulatory-like domain-containing protein, partial [Verrucomicrobia bacterium]|nr:carboxypeptidase regulatory-like domain-containing protein [Verrucomicrobiota bacterium]
MPRLHPFLLALFIAFTGCALAPLHAAERIAFDIPADTAEQSLKQFTKQSRAEVVYAAEVARGVLTPAVKGTLTPSDALTRLLAGTPLIISRDAPGNTFMISREPAARSSRAPAENTVGPAATASGFGTIEGRVINATNGEYVERARLTVEGTALETFTDSGGNFRLVGVPAGTARVAAFFTGL